MREIDVAGRIAYLMGKSEAFGQPKWTTAYLIEQILQVVVEHLENFPKENIVSPAQHKLLIKYLKEGSK